MYACDIKFVGINVHSTAESAKTAIFYTLEIYPLYSIINFKQYMYWWAHQLHNVIYPGQIKHSSDILLPVTEIEASQHGHTGKESIVCGSTPLEIATPKHRHEADRQ